MSVAVDGSPLVPDPVSIALRFDMGPLHLDHAYKYIAARTEVTAVISGPGCRT
jgi:hypothetical protein